VTEAYKVPFKFTGKIARVTVELKDVKAADRNETEKVHTTSVLKKALAD
jgi:arylsulfatase